MTGAAQRVACSARLASRLQDDGRPTESEMWFAKAARAGHPSAMYQLGLLKRATGQQDEAARWFAEAAEAGHLLASGEL
jgi:TPR repeat protein